MLKNKVWRNFYYHCSPSVSGAAKSEVQLIFLNVYIQLNRIKTETLPAYHTFWALEAVISQSARPQLKYQ